MMKLIVLLSVFCLVNSIPISKDNSNDRHKAMEHTGEKKGDGVIFQGDMVMKKKVHDYYFGDSEKRSKSADALRNKNKYWDLPIPYEFDSTIEEARKKAIEAGFDEYKKKTCITFRPKTSTDTDFISFTKDDGCWSYVGKEGGEQQISIGDGCEDMSTVAHEIMHALGFFHEQSRPDRDQYIEVKYDNNEEENKGNFEKQNSATVTTFDHPYDYKSTMHYDKFAFSKNEEATIIKKNDENFDDFGLGYQNITGLSEIDVLQLKAMYCNGKTGTTTVSTDGPSGTAATTTDSTSGTTTTSTDGTSGSTTVSTDGTSGTTTTSTDGTSGTTTTSTDGTSGTTTTSTDGTSTTASTPTDGTSGTTTTSTDGTGSTASTSTYGTSGTTEPTATTSTTTWEEFNKDEIKYSYDERKMKNDIARIENLMKDIKKTLKHSKMN